MTPHVPRLSVIITSYNRAQLLARCVGSVLSQDFPDFEVIIVDDASTDETPQIAEAFGDDRVRYERLSRNNGAPAKPRNIGMGLARAPIYFIFDSDDTMLPGCLAAFAQAFTHNPQLGMAWSYKNVLDRQGQLVEVEKRDRLTSEPAFPLALSYAPGANGLAIRKEVIDRIGGFDEAMPRMDDYEFTLRFLMEESWELAVLPVVTMNVHADSNDHVSASNRRTWAAREHVLRKHRALFARYPRDYARHLYNLALLRLQVRNDRIGFARALLESVRLDPRHARRLMSLWRMLPGALPGRSRPPRDGVRRVDLKQSAD
jgi:glycosyltransferase involved in cell wall biosynthesis